MPDVEVINRGIAAHARWKYRLFDAVETGRSEWTVEGIRSDDQCEFGRWLGSLSAADLSDEHCVKVKAMHTEFHQVAAEVLSLALAGRKEEAQEAIALGSRFALVSSNLTMAMSDWKEAVAAGG